MSSLSGKKARDFVVWLEEAKWYLPPKMSITEASELFDRKIKEEKELKDDL